jgi:hypothetical protein
MAAYSPLALEQITASLIRNICILDQENGSPGYLKNTFRAFSLRDALNTRHVCSLTVPVPYCLISWPIHSATLNNTVSL